MVEGLEITIRLCKERGFDDNRMANHLLKYMEELGMEPPPHQERRGTGYADEYGMEETHDEWVQGWEVE